MQAVCGLGDAAQQPLLRTGSKARGMGCDRVGAAAAGDREGHGVPEGTALPSGDRWVHTAPLTPALEAWVPVGDVDREGRAPASLAQAWLVLEQDLCRLSGAP